MSATVAIQTHEIVAYNYAHDSENKIHDDTVAAQYGFKGGLVPGAADYAYLCHPVYRTWGDQWLGAGTMSAKFIKPIYHGEVARAEARPTGDPNRLELALIDPRGVTCAVGSATLATATERELPSVEDYPRYPLPDPTERREPAVESFPAGLPLGSLEFEYGETKSHANSQDMFVENLVGPNGAIRWHPGECLHQANLILRSNLNLGPWVHTGSEVHYFGAPRDGELLSLRGSVIDTYLKRGHVVTDCDLVLFAGEARRPVVKIKHTAIIRLARG